ncbi:hypothetical protein Cgig2_030729 [Carnegiea gigantea]|uniref:CCHC-type domain-containing protein n=1 Tax=Carnegiea gigantea TaxID=171969 RepID=A0A9Q1QN50_9CARY|nr:hypothetical protein Cgig2_030729 [Carnegiea gigantea]
MATGLEEAWQNLRLTSDEEQVVIVDDEEDSSTSELILLCLLGRLYTTNSFNPRAMKAVLWNVWKSSKGLVIRDLDSNLCAFQFFSEADRDFVLNKGPWAFDGCILLFKQMIGLEVPSEVVFSMARFWVKAYDILRKKHTVSFAQMLASNIGFFVSYDEATMFGVDKDFCYGCGKLGHALANCDLAHVEDGDDSLQYGVWLRALPSHVVAM